eukprot:11190077-Lingulodinium_polyedra.AAC.1
MGETGANALPAPSAPNDSPPEILRRATSTTPCASQTLAQDGRDGRRPRTTAAGNPPAPPTCAHLRLIV